MALLAVSWISLASTWGTSGRTPFELNCGNGAIPKRLEPGPRFSEILSAVTETQLEGTLHTRDQAPSWIKERFDLHLSRTLRTEITVMLAS